MDSYVYKFMDYNCQIIYIGKTNHLKNRMKQHFGANPHLPKECYEQVYKIYCSNVHSKLNAEILETYLINKYHPIYNKDKKYRSDEVDLTMNYEEPKWDELLFLKVKSKNHLPTIEFLRNNPPYIDRNLMRHEAILKAFKYNYAKTECYNYEFKTFCPSFMEAINNDTKEIDSLYAYAQDNLDIDESNIDEFVNSNAIEQMNSNYLAFRISNITELAKAVPYFDVFLRYGFLRHIGYDIFAVHIITVDLLKNVESNVERHSKNQMRESFFEF